MVSVSLPQIACGVALELDELVLRIEFAASKIGSTTVDVLVKDPGTYFNDLEWTTGANNLLRFLGLWMTTAEIAAGTDGFVVGGSQPGGLPTYARLERSGTAGDVVTTLHFPHPIITPAFLGLVDGAPTDSGSTPSNFQRWDTSWLGACWRPNTWASRDYSWEKSAVAVSVSPYSGASVVDKLGGRRVQPLHFEAVYGCYFFEDFVNAEFAALVTAKTPDALGANDKNAALQSLWRCHQLSKAPLRYWRDRDDLATFVDIEVVDKAWLEDLTVGSDRVNDGPVMFDFTIPAQRFVP